MPIYTRGGDDGTTGLLDGVRRPKDDPRVEAYGSVDELDSAVGFALAWCRDPWTGGLLRAIQCDLFALAARLASPADVPAGAPLAPSRVAALEAAIDDVDRQVPALHGFIRPGGEPAAAALHLARTICRRAERRLVALARTEPVEPLYLHYLNRLGDLLFSLARFLNHRAGQGDEPLSGPTCGG